MQLTNSNTHWPEINGKTIDIAALRAKGFSVIINSFRYVKHPYVFQGHEVMVPVPMPVYEIRRLDLQDAILSKGGYTTVKLTKPGITVVGEARVNPSDSFCKGVGVKIALGKAVAELSRNGVNLA
jgi:hypothetical protein